MPPLFNHGAGSRGRTCMTVKSLEPELYKLVFRRVLFRAIESFENLVFMRLLSKNCVKGSKYATFRIFSFFGCLLEKF